MERHLPHSDGRVRTRPGQPPLIRDPENGIDAPRHGIRDRDFLRGLPDAPYVYVRVQRAGSAVQRVRGPAQRIHAGRVE